MNDKYIKKMNVVLNSQMWRQAHVFNDGEAAIDLLNAASGDGRIVTSVRALAARWGWRTKRTRLFLKRLADMGFMNIDSSHNNSIITIDDEDNIEHTSADNAGRGTPEGTTKALTNSHLQPTGAQQKANAALRKGTPEGTTTVLNVNNLQPTGAQQRANAAAETSTIAPIVYSNEYISIKDKSLIDAPYARRDVENYSTNEEKTSRAGTTESSRPLSAADYEALAEHYNAAAAHSCLPPLRALTPKRKAMLRARCREYGAEALITAIDKAAASPFLNGDNRRGWRANFDWIFRPNNFIKIIENNYDEKFQKARADIYRRPSREEEKLRRDQEFAQHLYNKLNNPEPEPELADI